MTPAPPSANRLQALVKRLGLMRWEISNAGSLRVWMLYLPGPGPWLMSWLRKRWVVLRNPHAQIEFRGRSYLGPGFSLDMPRGGIFIAGHGVEFRRGFRAEFARGDTRIEIGDLAVFSYDVIIQCTTSVVIGAHCQFGQNALIVDGNHRFRDLGRPMLEQGYDYKPVEIHDHAVVTTKCTIIADVGERTYVGAHSVVSHPLPAFCVAVGTPAKVIDYFGPPGREPAELALVAPQQSPG